jgi:choline monooxygenase
LAGRDLDPARDAARNHVAGAGASAAILPPVEPTVDAAILAVDGGASRQSVDELAHAQTLPASAYLDPDVFELERDRIFGRTWQIVARSAELARPGDFVPTSILDEPLVAVRDLDGTLRAFFNVCRHRAGQVALVRGNRKSLQCQYHGWTYGLDGTLRAAPEMDDAAAFDKREYGLVPVRVVEWGPFVFASLDDATPPLGEVLGAIPGEIAEAGYDVARMDLVERRDYTIACNWKVYVDNYLEGYHIPIAHPALFRELDYDAYRVETHRFHSKQHAPVRELKPDDVPGRDRRYVRSADGEGEALYYWVFPNLMFNIYPDNMSMNLVVPLGVDRTLTIFEWYFAQPGTGAGWESMQQTIAFSDQIQQEDIALCEQVQRGLHSRSYDRGRFSPRRENGVFHFQSLVREALA